MAYIIHRGTQFEWDAAKDRTNRDKHGLSFRDASELFASCEDYLEIYDEAHSVDEDRFIAVGPSPLGIIVVIYTEREDDVIRIVSARKATGREEKRFEAFRRGNHGRR